MIWALCDLDADGSLDELEFCLALHLAARRFMGAVLQHGPARVRVRVRVRVRARVRVRVRVGQDYTTYESVR